MSDKPDFIERVAALAGRTTYRVPVAGRSTAARLTEQDVAAAIAMGRRRRGGVPDWTDIGPEVAIGMVCQIRHRKPDVVEAVARAISTELRQQDRYYRIRIAVNAAYESLIMDGEIERPKQFPVALWEAYYAAAFSVLVNSAHVALERAERALYKSAS